MKAKEAIEPLAIIFALPPNVLSRLKKLGIVAENDIQSFLWMSIMATIVELEKSPPKKNPKKE